MAALGVSLPTARLRGRDGLLRILQDEADQIGWALGSRS